MTMSRKYLFDLYEPYFFGPDFLNRVHKNRIMLKNLRERFDYLSAKASNTKPNCKKVKKFKVMLDVKYFNPDDVEVKVVDNFVVVHGKREEPDDQHGFVSREFTKRYQLPADVDGDTIESSWSPDGVLTVYSPEKAAKLLTNERVVPVTIAEPFGYETVLEDLKFFADFWRKRAQKYAM